MHSKWTYFVISQCLLLSFTNTLAYHESVMLIFGSANQTYQSLINCQPIRERFLTRLNALAYYTSEKVLQHHSQGTNHFLNVKKIIVKKCFSYYSNDRYKYRGPTSAKLYSHNLRHTVVSQSFSFAVTIPILAIWTIFAQIYSHLFVSYIILLM